MIMMISTKKVDMFCLFVLGLAILFLFNNNIIMLAALWLVITCVILFDSEESRDYLSML